jgi:hypothetical protein
MLESEKESNSEDGLNNNGNNKRKESKKRASSPYTKDFNAKYTKLSS